jgi:hypothetical protein
VKPAAFFLAASLLGNVTLVALLLTHHSSPQAARPLQAAAGRTGAPADARKNTDALNAALASGDAAALEAAGISPQVARELAIGRMFSRVAEKLRGAQAKNSADSRWWRARPGAPTPGSREQQLVARRELSDALVAAFGDDLGLGAGDQSQLAFLAPEKREALRRIIQDYDEMMAKFGAGGVQLASDREKLRLLRQERDRDIAALLTPDERAAYEMRTSASGNTVRNRYGDAIESEGEFQKIYALQKNFDEAFPREALTGRISPDVIHARAAAERQLENDIRAAVGDDRYAALRRAADADVRTIDALAARLNLPPSTTDNVLASRDTYSAESQRITNDTSVPMPQRRAQIQALANQAKSDLTRALGSEAAEAYAQRSPWMNMLQNGMAYSTTPQEGAPGSLFAGGQSVYPVMPAGAMPAGAQRQFVINASPPVDGAVGGDHVVGSNVQVMTFTTSSSGDQSAPPAAGTSATVPQTQRTVIAPGSPAPAAPQPKR